MFATAKRSRLAASVALVALASVPATLAAPSQFEVKSLPGWEGPLLSKAYCGFSSAGVPPSGQGEMFFNYILIEAETDPANAPTIIWYNGGPGAASMFGLFVELGPYYLNQDSFDDPNFKKTGIPQVQRNPYAWTKLGNVIAVNNPPPIGYSYCTGQKGNNTGPSGDGYSCGPWNDDSVAKANAAFIRNLFTADFPEYAKNPLFIVGESYAGVYVPTIVRELWEDAGPVNLAGFAVGDGCMGTQVLCGSDYNASLPPLVRSNKGPWYDVEFMHGHGQASERNYRTIMAQCPEAALRSGDGMSAACKVAVKQLQDNLGGMFGYSLYDDCIYDESFRRRRRRSEVGGEGAMQTKRLAGSESVRGNAAPWRGGLNDYACPSDAMTVWLNRSDVRAALHIQPDNRFNSADNGVGMNYTLTEPNVLPIWDTARQMEGFRALAYNGDTDPGINSMVTQDKFFGYWDSIGAKETEAWRPWTTDGKQRMGGYVVSVEGNFHYLTIRGSGHMVPEYKASQTLAFLGAFVNGEEFPKYVAPAPGQEARDKKLWE